MEPSLAGPRRPQDRVVLGGLRDNFRTAYPPVDGAETYPTLTITGSDGSAAQIGTGSVAIAAITSCTNTSNPSVMLAAGLVARNAVAKGLTVPPTVKTSLAPGSRAVTAYLQGAGLLEPLADLGFDVVGYGCTTCIGNSGPLDEPVTKAIEDNDLVVAAVLSGNRNFEGRIHPFVRASYLASPPLVVAFALAGRVDIDLTTTPLGTGSDGQPVMLADIWPSPEEVKAAIAGAVSADLFRTAYASVFTGDEQWRSLPVPTGDRYVWDPDSSYIARPPFFEGLTKEPAPITDIEGARVLAVLGDSVTTDHISPAGSIPAWSPAGRWLEAKGVTPFEFNSYGARRGHHEVMMRGTFGNIRLKNALATKEGPYTTFQPSGEEMFLYGASMRYQAEGTPLVILAGQEYGSGLVARLGGQGHPPAGRARGHRPELRAHPPLQPRGHGRAAAPVPAGRERPVAGPHRSGGAGHRRPRGRARATQDAARHRDRRRTAPCARSTPSAASTDRSRSTTTARGYPPRGAAPSRRRLIGRRPPRSSDLRPREAAKEEPSDDRRTRTPARAPSGRSTRAGRTAALAVLPLFRQGPHDGQGRRLRAHDRVRAWRGADAGRPLRTPACQRPGDRRAPEQEEGARDLQLGRHLILGLRDRGDHARAHRGGRRVRCS